MTSVTPLHAVPDFDLSATLSVRRPIDAMFRAMCESGASDLHLSIGTPPLVRKDGRMQPLDPAAAPLTLESIAQLLDPVMPESNRREFRDQHDTDFAYE